MPYFWNVELPYSVSWCKPFHIPCSSRKNLEIQVWHKKICLESILKIIEFINWGCAVLEKSLEHPQVVDFSNFLDSEIVSTKLTWYQHSKLSITHYFDKIELCGQNNTVVCSQDSLLKYNIRIFKEVWIYYKNTMKTLYIMSLAHLISLNRKFKFCLFVGLGSSLSFFVTKQIHQLDCQNVQKISCLSPLILQIVWFETAKFASWSWWLGQTFLSEKRKWHWELRWPKSLLHYPGPSQTRNLHYASAMSNRAQAASDLAGPCIPAAH